MQDYAGYQQYAPQGYQQPMAQPTDELVEGMIIHSTPQFEPDEGDYNFLVKTYNFGFFQPKKADSKIPPCKTVEYTLLIPYRNPETGAVVYGQTKYQLKLTPMLMGVLAKFFEATGAVPEYQEFAIDFNLPLGRTGVCVVGKRADGGGVFTSIKDVYRPSQRPTITMNDGLPFEPQIQNGYGA